MISNLLFTLIGAIIGAIVTLLIGFKQLKLTRNISKINLVIDMMKTIHNLADRISAYAHKEKHSSLEKEERKDDIRRLYRELGDVLDSLAFALFKFDDDELFDYFKSFIIYHYVNSLRGGDLLTEDDIKHWKYIEKFYKKFKE